MDQVGPSSLPLGQRTVSEEALTLLSEAAVDPETLFDRQAARDWGYVNPTDRKRNDQAAETGGFVVSPYSIAGTLVVVVTEPDRSRTHMMTNGELPIFWERYREEEMRRLRKRLQERLG